jgi:DNA-directed RNA polymerase subunit P
MGAVMTDMAEDNIPGDNIPGDNIPGDNIPGDNIPGDNIPGDNIPGDIIADDIVADPAPSEMFDVSYSCLRCGTNVSNIELSRLPEIKCICGFRVFVKVRPPVVKTIKAV